MEEKEGKKRIFVVQEHNARNLHWDFRIERNNVLESWAIPKEPTMDEGRKRLAIKVDDHSIEYADFEGEIKEGYGKGSVKIWDKGYYDMANEKENKIIVNLHGKKLKGEFVLLRFKKAGENAWLFFKKKKE